MTGGLLPLSFGHSQEIDIWTQIHGYELNVRSGLLSKSVAVLNRLVFHRNILPRFPGSAKTTVYFFSGSCTVNYASCCPKEPESGCCKD